MPTPRPHLFTLVCIAAATSASAQTALFTGRFPFTSIDQPNERPGGSITRLEEFDFSYVTISPGAAARTLLPTTALQCYLGDANADGIYTKFANPTGPWKTYFQDINIGGIFVKAADRAAVTWDKVYFTVRRNAASTAGAAVGTLQVEVFENGGANVRTLVPGDWVRLLPGGNLEVFMTAAQLFVAAGPATGVQNNGAGALLQAANGDLYYSPVDGGHRVSGGQLPQFANDGSIVKIDAANISYDPLTGNVLSFTPNSARLILEEVGGGPSSNPQSIRGMVVTSGALDRNGIPLTTGSYAKTVGLAFDPAGTQSLSRWPDPIGNFTLEPDILFCTHAGAYAGTIFSTANNGSIATINGVQCGNTTGPANGSWLGVQLIPAQFEPTLMGFTLCDALLHQPLVIDQNGLGRLPVVSTQATWDVDVFGAPFLPVFMLVTLGPTTPGGIVPSVPLIFLPPWFTPDSHKDVFLVTSPLTLGVAVTDSFGYGTVSVPNPNTGAFSGTTLMVQGLGLAPTGFTLTTPLLTQLN
ncbi:MAG: hypothetical protein ABIP94_04255 [Planctomycetota bacterium]